MFNYFILKTGNLIKSVKKHSNAITDIQFGHTNDYFIAASKDQSASIFETETLNVFKKFETERPVNSAAISPIKPHVNRLDYLLMTF